MRKVFVASLFVLAMSLSVFAQSSSKMDVFGGYSFVRFNPGNGADAVNHNGWESTATFNLNQKIGIAADFNGSYKSENGADNKMYTYMFGPEIKMGNDKGSAFFHGLAGFAHESVTANLLGTNFSVSDNAFATAFGGGYDWRASDAISIRLFQADYLITRFGSATQNNIRLAFGVTFHPKFGGRGL